MKDEERRGTPDPEELHPGTGPGHPAPPSPESETRVEGGEFDVLVIGGGIQGVGVLQAAAARGHRAGLLERREAAIGTSSRSSKLIHGGLRYLETMQIRLVFESLRERRILATIAPHLVRLVPFHIPVYKGMSRGRWTIRAGLSLYAMLGLLKEHARFKSLPRSTWAELDGLETKDLRAVFRYFDGQTDDAALCRAVLSSAIELGALADAGAEVIRAERLDGDPDGMRWRVTYRRNGQELEARTRVVINASGPWANLVNALATPAPRIREIDLVGGSHIEIEGQLDRGIYYTEAPSDKRAVFSIPWKGRIMVGTTEAPYEGDPAKVEPTPAEIDYLESIHRHYFPNSNGRLLGAWAGLRVLPRAKGAAFDRPRDVMLVSDDENRPSWLTIYGGKLTGYRHTGGEVLDAVRASLAEVQRLADTATLRLPDLGEGHPGN